MTKLSIKQLKEKLSFADVVSRKDDVITVRRGFFYTHGMTSDDIVKKVKKAFPNAKILDQGEKWVAFRGGASVSNQSHWWVKFELNRVKK